MKVETNYILTEEEVIAIKKITGNISDVDFMQKFKLTAIQMELIKNLYDKIPFEEESE